MHSLPLSVKDKLDRNLHKQKNHPLEITKRYVYKYFDSLGRDFVKYEDCSKIVTVKDNFDLLLIPKDHPARRPSDSFYLTKDTLLRTHTTAHQNEILSSGERNFLITGDVYRRDTVDRTHFPLFHQIEGVTSAKTNDSRKELETIMIGLVNYLFPGKAVRINNDYFPFTDPSIEVEVQFFNDWLEVLGGGIVHSLICKPLKINTSLLAWGIGIERLAMILFNIPDIRLFWTEDKKFINQFGDGQIKHFIPYSSIEPIQRDISFWLPEERILCTNTSFEWMDINLFLEYVRESGGEIVESITLFDKFLNPNNKKYSLSFHICFSPVVSWQNGAHLVKKANEAIYYLRESIATKFNVQLR